MNYEKKPLKYEDNKIVGVDAVVLSILKEVSQKDLHEGVMEEIIKPAVLQVNGFLKKLKFFINPFSRFVGGPMGDCGFNWP